MKILLILLWMGLISQIAAADIQEFTREYTYNASETDSKVSARKAAMQQLQSLVIEEVGVQVQSSFKNKETLSDDEFTRHVQANYETFSQALTKTQVLKETWDGESFYLKAKIIVDTDNLIERIQTVYVNVGGNTPKPEDVCKARDKKVLALLNEVRTTKVVKELTEISKAHGFDRSCNFWQYTILKSFASDLTDDETYRKHLFLTVTNHESDAMSGELLIEVLKYALLIRPLSDPEWTIVRDTVARAKPTLIHNVIALLVRHTKRDMSDDASKRDVDYNTRRQDVVALKEKLAKLIEEAGNGVLNWHEKISIAEVAYTALIHAMNYQPKLAKEIFDVHFRIFDEVTQKKLARNIVSFYNEHPSEASFEMLKQYYQRVSVDKKVAAVLFRQLESMKKKPMTLSDFGRTDFIRLTSSRVPSFGKIIDQARTSSTNKSIWRIELGLTSENVCLVDQCAKKLFSKKRMEVEQAADFLIAYGKRAEPVKEMVIKKLSRLKALNKVSNDTRLIPKLLIILDNLESTDSESIELIVWALGDVSKKINEQAMKSLERVGYKSLPILTKLFHSQKATPQRRMIDVMGTFKKDKQQTLAFLTKVKPGNQHIRFAIEDATEALNN